MEIIERIVYLTLLIGTVRFIMFIAGIEGGSYDSKKKIGEEEVHIIKSPKIFLWLGSFCTISFVWFLVMMILSGESVPLEGYIMTSCFILLGFYIIIACMNYRLILRKDTFTYRNFFRKQYSFCYRDVDKLYIKKSYIKVTFKENKKKLFIDSNALGIEVFIHKIPPQRRK